MTNDTTTLNGALMELGELMANNLESMGVDDVSAEDGLTSLANEILNIEPSVSGLNLTTSITLTPEAYNIPKNTSFTLTSILSAEYDDTTVTDVDLSGVLTGANVIFKDSNNNILCTAVTNSNGVAIGTVTNGLSQNATITAYFEGTDNFASCQSSSINIEAHYYELGLTSNNTVIQSGDVETLTATLTDSSEAMENETISFKIYKNGVLENTVTDTTDSNGMASISYTGAGIGDVDIVADWDNEVQSNTLTIEDCIYYDATEYSSTHNYNWTLPSDNFIVSFEVYPQSRSNCFPQLSIGESSDKFAWVGQGYTNGQNSMLYKVNNTTEKSVSGNTVNSLNEYTPIKYIYVNGEHNLIANNETITLDMNMTPQTLFQCYNSNSKIKNVKVKPLLDLSLSSNKQVVSYSDSESTTLTATLVNGGTPLVGKTISFYANDTLLGTNITDNNGEATYTYDSEGVGDIDIQADWDNKLQSEIISIEDCIYAHSMTVDDGHWSPLRTDGGTIFTEDGFRLGNANWTDVYFDTELPKPCSVEFNVPDYDCSSQPVQLGYLWDSTKTNRLIHALLNNFGGVNKILLEEYPNSSYITYTLPKGSRVRFEIKEDIIELYVNNNLIKSKSYSMPLSWVYGLTCAGSRYIYVKDMKIKPL